MVTPDPPAPPFNPYAAPAAPIEPPLAPWEDDSEAASLRQPNLSREAAVRLVGSIAYVVAGFTFLGGLLGLITAGYCLGLLGGRWAPGTAGFTLFYGLTWLFVSLISAVIGRDICQLVSRSRNPMMSLLQTLLILLVTLAVIFGLVGEMPLAAAGLLLTAITPTAALATLHSPRTARLFQPDYREAIALTPSLRPRLSLRTRCLLALVLTLSASGIGLLVWSFT